MISDYMLAVRNYYIQLLPRFPRKCPIEGNYTMKNVNVTIINESGDKFSHEDKIGEVFVTPKLPNGIYRQVVKMYNDDDPVGFAMYWHIENYDSMDDDRL